MRARPNDKCKRPLLRATGIPIGGRRAARPHGLARGATQLNQSAALRYTCPDRRISKAMVTLARAAQLHYHDFAAWPCGPRENLLNIMKVILRKCGRGLSLCPATTLDNTLTGGTLSEPTSGHLLQALPYAHHSTFHRARGALAIRLEFPRARCSRCKLY